MLYKLILGPLELLFDVIYAWAMQLIRNPGLAIVFLSLAINLLVLPLYKRADAVQEQERETAKRLKPGIDHIKKVFKGDERVMILQTFYRQNNYKPYYALKGTLSLLLEIPFFIAAYNYLSHLQLIQGVSFGPIADLGAPDGLLKIFGLTINLLPVLMTLINIISGAIYTKGMPLKSKIQLYGMALIFLVLLYNSPSGLVFYWTLNNLFSLGKNIVFRIWPPKKTDEAEEAKYQGKEKKGIFIAACITLTLLTGLLIPSAVIKSSPGEFVSAAALANPLHYVLHAVLIAAGTFLIWLNVYYRLAKRKNKGKYALATAIAAIAAIVNFMFFGKDYGNLSSILKYDQAIAAPQVSTWLLNLGVLFVIAGLVWLLWKKQEKILSVLCVAAAVAIAAMAGMNMVEINNKYGQIKKVAEAQATDEKPTFSLDKNGKNTVVLMLDRAISGFIPYLFNEKPVLKEQFSGFTWYPNTLSYGGFTNVGTPPLFGGYDYVPDEIQKRDDVDLADKQNEALKIMPVNFMNSGFEVTVCDPTYANYYWTPDVSIYNDYPAIRKFVTEGAFTKNKQAILDRQEHLRTRNFFCYSFLRSSPVLLHTLFYNDGRYNEAEEKTTTTEETELDTLGNLPTDTPAPTEAPAEGETSSDDDDFADYSYDSSEDDDFADYSSDSSDGENSEEEYDTSEDNGENTDYQLETYWPLVNLPYMTQVTSDGRNTFLMMSNNLTHEVFNIQGPDYDPTVKDPNSTWDAEHKVKTSWDGKEISLDGGWQQAHYSCNMAALLRVGEWLDYLKENGVYDNTRIIIVSDHGRDLGYFGMQLEQAGQSAVPEEDDLNWLDVMLYNPLLLVKDFGTTGDIKTDNTFMTNADTPFLAFRGQVKDPENPFLEKKLSDETKNNPEQHICITNWRTDENDGTTFLDPKFLTLKGHNIFDLSAWSVDQ